MKPTHPYALPAKSKGMGCLACPILLTVRGVSIGDDYRGANKLQRENAETGRVRTHRISGTGPKNAKVLVLLESPSVADDKAGQIDLNENDAGRIAIRLERAGVTTSEIRFTYAVRCYCPKKPPDPAYKACNGYLSKEIARIDPDIIVPVGSGPLKFLAGNSFSIESCAGTPFIHELCGRERTILPIWSPGYVRYFEEKVPEWKDQFSTVKKLMDGKVKPKMGLGKYVEVKTAKRAADMLDAIVDGRCGIDIETNTLNPHETKVLVPQYERDSKNRLVFKRTDTGKRAKVRPKYETAKIAMVSWSTKPGTGFYVLRNHADGTWDKHDRRLFDRALKRLLKRTSVAKRIWNEMFERVWFRVKLKCGVRNSQDVMVRHFQADENEKHGLKDAASACTGMAGWDDEVNRVAKTFNYNFAHIPVDISGPYSGADPDATIRVEDSLEGALDPAREKIVSKFYPALLPELADMQARGMKGDIKFAGLYEKYTRAEADAAFQSLCDIPQVRRFIRKNQREDEHKGTKKEWVFNPGSDAQVRTILTDYFEYEAINETDTGEMSVDAETLKHYEQDHQCPFSTALLKYRKYKKLHGTYAKTLLERLRRTNGFIYGYFRHTGTKTGRLASADPNRQNESRSAKRIYISRFGHLGFDDYAQKISELGGDVSEKSFVSKFGEQGCLITLDYSQIEVRVAACVAKDQTLLDLYKDGADVHLVNMCKIFGFSAKHAARMEKDDNAEYEKKRTIAKRVVFGCVPLDTDCLTKRGWLRYEDIRVGDMVLGYEKGRLVWTPVLLKVKHKNAPLIEISHEHGFRAVTTPDHRWIGERRTTVGKGRRRTYKQEFTTTEDINGEHRIFLSAPVAAIDESGLTPDEAAFVAWSWCEGTQFRAKYTGKTSQGSDGRRIKTVWTITQSYLKNKSFVKEIDALVTRLFKGRCTRYVHKEGTIEWKLSGSDARDLRRKVYTPTQRTQEDVVRRMGTKQREAFLDAVRKAEGTKRDDLRVISQNDGPMQEAIRLAAFMSGYYVTDSFNGEYKGKINRKLVLSKPVVTGQRLRRRSVKSADAWCIKTACDTWVMMQHGHIMLTGNTLYGIGPPGLCRLLFSSHAITITEEEAAEYIDSFFRAYPVLEEWIQRTYRKIMRDGESVSPMGRIRHVPWVFGDPDSEEGRKRIASGKRQAMNAIVQGSASDMTQTALALIGRALRRAGLRARICCTVHDSIVIDSPISEAARAVRIAKRIMENLPEHAWPIWGKNFNWKWLRCPIVAEAKVGINWRDSVKFDPDSKNPEKTPNTISAAMYKSVMDMRKNDSAMMAAYEELRKAA